MGWDAYETCSRCDYNTYVEKPVLEPDAAPTYNVVTSIENGDKVIIAAPAYGKALSVLKVATHYNKGVDYTLTDFGNITNSEIFTVTAYSDGTYKFTSQTGVVIALSDEYNSLNGSGENNLWTLDSVQGKSGVFYVKNTVRSNYLEWYAEKGNWSTYKNAGSDLFEISFYLVEKGEGGTVAGGNTGGNTGGTTSHTYTDFTSAEKALLTQYIGVVIPFVANDEYLLLDWNGETSAYDLGFYFGTVGNTEAEYNAYRNLIVASGYEFDSTYVDEYGDTCYLYYNGDVVIDVCFYEYDGESYIDLFVYSETLSTEPDDSTGDTGGDNTGGNTGGTGGTNNHDNLITNDGKGLPADDGDGIVDVDFTDADKVKNVTDQGYYLDGCPTTGAPAVLVIPVEFSDVTAASKGYDFNKIITAFTGANGTTDYHSVEEYYKISSYGKLDINVTVLDTWFRPQHSSSYYKEYTMPYGESEIEAGDQLIIDEILRYLAPLMDLSDFDSDGNGIIDAIVIINTLDIDADSNFNGAYRFWNVYTDDEGYYYEYDGVSVNDYLWASYAFMHETYDDDGNVSYDDTDAINTYTYIHEFAHVLGADDYYDTSYSGDTGPLDGADIMDSMQGDHNAFTKFNYGWITESKLVVTDTSVEVVLSDFYTTGDTLIIANNWDESLGAYQEYYIIVFYTNNGLNSNGNGYFTRDGIVVYHVNASLYSEEYDGEMYYDIYNNNTDASDDYGTEDNLIEYVKSAGDTFTYIEGYTIPTVVLDSGDTLIYTFVVDEIGTDSATITVSRVAQ